MKLSCLKIALIPALAVSATAFGSEKVEITDDLLSDYGIEVSDLPESMVIKVPLDQDGNEIIEEAQVRNSYFDNADVSELWGDSTPEQTYDQWSSDDLDQEEYVVVLDEEGGQRAGVETLNPLSNNFNVMSFRRNGYFVNNFRHSSFGHRYNRSFHRNYRRNSFFRDIFRPVHRSRYNYRHNNRHNNLRSFWGFHRQPRSINRRGFRYHSFRRWGSIFGGHSVQTANVSTMQTPNAFQLAHLAHRGNFSDAVLNNGNELGSHSTFCNNFNFNEKEVVRVVFEEAAFANMVAANAEASGFVSSLDTQIESICNPRN